MAMSSTHGFMRKAPRAERWLEVRGFGNHLLSLLTAITGFKSTAIVAPPISVLHWKRAEVIRNTELPQRWYLG